MHKRILYEIEDRNLILRLIFWRGCALSCVTIRIFIVTYNGTWMESSVRIFYSDVVSGNTDCNK